MTCGGEGRRACPSEAAVSEVRLMRETFKRRADPMPMLAFLLCVNGIVVIMLLMHVVFGKR